MRASTWHGSALISVAVLAVAGCGHSNPDREPEDPVLVSLAISPPTLTLDRGASRALAVTGTFDDGTIAAVTTGLTWTSSASQTATVGATGTVAAVGAGTATITARTDDGVEGTATVTVPDVATGLPIFTDDYGDGLAFAAFGGSNTAVTIDDGQAKVGSRSLRLAVPASGYMGGTIRATSPADLSSFNAITFWVKASRTATLDKVGFGNDLGASALNVEWSAVPVTETWTRHVLPLPAPARLTAEIGLFHVAEGAELGATYDLWIDELRYERVEVAQLGTPMPAIATEMFTPLVGDTLAVPGASVTYTIDGAPRSLETSRRYFTFRSSAPEAATVDASGVVTAVAVGTATITAKFGDLDAVGAITVDVMPLVVPVDPAPTPTAAVADVLALFSDAYPPAAVDTWRTSWSNATLEEMAIGTDAVKKYTNLAFVGVEFVGAHAVDATAMTHFHVDVWMPAVTTFRVKLVDFGADNAYGGGDDTEHEVPFDATTMPALAAGAWVGLDIPLSDFAGLTARAHLSQLIFSTTSASTVYVDNVYFHRVTPPPAGAVFRLGRR